MCHLTEAEQRLLSEAEDNLRRAQAAYDKLAPLRLKETFDVTSPRKLAHRQKGRTLAPVESNSQPKDVTKNRETRKFEQHSTARLRALIYGEPSRPSPSMEPAELLELYQKVVSIDLFASRLEVTRQTALSLLKSAGKDVVEEISQEWQNGSSLRDLSSKHGPLPQTISRWIKSTGRQIKPRNSNPKYDQSLVLKLSAEKWSINRIATHMGISWATVRRTIVSNM
ncbi:helix-turn-helix domain-containing protein [Aliiroseovarius sp. Z3]|uniref:helix-turn-helix domain-containing protein n=1 Tax=Aliiroseovarius sp. Z3 TaxID=2811402 RepID=UPI0023B2109A|nr:helix-turn-helix domain-containing protein [Aliiroseovarius sp. Z3]MDE9451517.1 helix-turn-helix domain-containing protein [Aliiroseovarius sp. Z3]